MALKDPVAVYNAATNQEAQMVCDRIRHAGFEAFLIEDISRAGMWALGLLPEIHKPQVFVDRPDVERVVPILEEHERVVRERREVDATEISSSDESLSVTCEACGHVSRFPLVQRGSVQSCQNCRAYLDVGDEPPEAETVELDLQNPDCE